MIASLPNFEQKVQDLKKQIEELTLAAKTNERQRMMLMKTLAGSLNEVQSGREVVMRMLLRPQEYAVTRIALELDIPAQVQKLGGRCTAEQLSKATGAELLLIQRIMRPLCCMQVFKEAGEYQYEATQTSEFLATTPNLADGAKYMFDVAGRAAMALPEYIASIDHKCPSEYGGAFQLAFGKGTDNFSYIGSDKKKLTHFQNFMAWQAGNRIMWYDWYPLEQQLLADFDSRVSPYLMIDCGGGHGGDIKLLSKRLAAQHANSLPLSTKLAVQDLESVIKNNHATPEHMVPPVEPIAHSFLDAQPEAYKHAKAYYMRRVTHNWNDENVLKMLTNMRDAMKPNYSKLLINDIVLPDQGAGLWPSLIDINMMAIFSGAERTEGQFRALCDQVKGLKVNAIYGDPMKDRIVEIIRVE